MSNINLPYREGTPLEQILSDGWSRGFEPEQTEREANLMGYTISLQEIEEDWEIRTNKMFKDIGEL